VSATVENSADVDIRDVPADPVRALRHALYRAAKGRSGRRFHALMDKVLRSDVLWRAWVMVRSNHGAPGIDKITLAEPPEGCLKEVSTGIIHPCRRPSPRDVSSGAQARRHETYILSLATCPSSTRTICVGLA
jgi:hypothetical protein